jgi:hypothetical protein
MRAWAVCTTATNEQLSNRSINCEKSVFLAVERAAVQERLRVVDGHLAKKSKFRSKLSLICPDFH